MWGNWWDIRYGDFGCRVASNGSCMVGEQSYSRPNARSAEDHCKWVLVDVRRMTASKLSRDPQLMLVALFQNKAGVRTAKSMPPIVEWSSARIDDV